MNLKAACEKTERAGDRQQTLSKILFQVPVRSESADVCWQGYSQSESGGRGSHIWKAFARGRVQMCSTSAAFGAGQPSRLMQPIGLAGPRGVSGVTYLRQGFSSLSAQPHGEVERII